MAEQACEHRAVRRRLKQRRRRLPEAYRRAAERATHEHLRRLGAVRIARRLAVYLAVNGELDLSALIADAEARRKLVYAPVLEGDGLRFSRLGSDTDLRRNALGILEPRDGPWVDPRRLDVVLVPLVAFDDAGTRIGMGGGHYDRCFRFLASRSHWFRPKLVGIAFEFQRVASIDRRSWDVPLWAAVTENGIYRF